MIRYSVVVPCYNEVKNIPQLVENFYQALKDESGIELILVDNGSRDGTGEVIEREIASRRASFMRKVTVDVNQGYGFGILAGLKKAQGGILAWTHADLQTDPKDVAEAFHRYLEVSKLSGNVLVKGHRTKRRWDEKLLSFGMQVAAKLVLGVWLEEINAQPKLFPRQLFDLMRDAPHDFSLDVYLLWLAKSKGYSIVTIPVEFSKRVHGEAKGGSGSSLGVRWKLILRTFTYLFELKKWLNRKR